MNEHLRPSFETVLPTIQNAGIRYWVYGGIAIAGINGAYCRDNPDVDIFVLDDDYDRTIDLVAGLEQQLNWEHRDADQQRERRKREWRIIGTKGDILSIVPVFPQGDSVRFVFERDFVPSTNLTEETRTIGTYSFITPSKEFLKELLIRKVNRGRLIKQRRKKLRKDAKVVMDHEEYNRLCDRLDAMEK